MHGVLVSNDLMNWCLIQNLKNTDAQRAFTISCSLGILILMEGVSFLYEAMNKCCNMVSCDVPYDSCKKYEKCSDRLLACYLILALQNEQINGFAMWRRFHNCKGGG